MDEIQLLISGGVVPFILDAWRRLYKLEQTVNACKVCQKGGK